MDGLTLNDLGADVAAVITAVGGAPVTIVWREFAATSAIGAVCFVGALLRFRKALTAIQR